MIFINHLLGMPLHPGQVKYLRETTLRKTKINILVPSNRWGKAQGVDEPVLTPSGWVRMGDIKPGDFVISQDGTSTKVVDVFPQGQKEVYKVTFDDGSWTEACGEHNWTVKLNRQRFTKNYNENGKDYPNSQYDTWVVKTTDELRAIDLSKSGNRPVIPMVSPIQFPARQVPMEPYLLGLLLGDGGLTGGSVLLTSADQELVDYISTMATVKPTGKYGYRLLGMYKQARAAGIMGLGSSEKYVPEDYLFNTPEVRLAVLQGLMDTDGSINTQNRAMELSTCSKQLSENVKFLVQSLGGKAKIYEREPYYLKKGKKCFGKLSYRIKIDLRLPPFRLTRKLSLWETKKHTYKNQRVLRSIELIGKKEAQCIRVAHPSALYVTREFIVTHNSSMIACLQIWYLFYKFGIPPGNRNTWFKALYRTANVAPNAAVVETVFQYIDQILTSSFAIRLPDGRIVSNECQIEWFYLRDKTNSSPPFKQFFSNNSYIEHRTLGATAADSLEGKPFGLITYDEGGRSNHLEREVNGTILARLFDWDGPLHIPSTPDQNSPSILFHYKMYKDGLVGANNTYTMEGQLKDNYFFTPKHIQKQYDLYEHNPLRDQVLHGKFVFGGDTIFNTEDILNAVDNTLDDGERYVPGNNYVIATDTAIGSDEMVHTVLDTTSKPFRLVRQPAAKGNSKSPQMHLNDFVDLYDSYRDENFTPPYILETWNGESVRFYHDLPPHIQVNTKCYGSWQPAIRSTDNQNRPQNRTQAVKKADIILALNKLLASGELKIPNNPDLTQQLSIYKEKDDNLPTDRVMSLALAAWLATEKSTFNKEIRFTDW